MGTSLFSYKVSRGIHSMLNSVVTDFCFDSKLVKTFFWSPQRKIWYLCKNLCCSITGNSAWRSHCTCTAKVRDNRLFGKVYSAKSLEPPLVERNGDWRTKNKDKLKIQALELLHLVKRYVLVQSTWLHNMATKTRSQFRSRIKASTVKKIKLSCRKHLLKYEGV